MGVVPDWLLWISDAHDRYFVKDVLFLVGFIASTCWQLDDAPTRGLPITPAVLVASVVEPCSIKASNFSNGETVSKFWFESSIMPINGCTEDNWWLDETNLVDAMIVLDRKSWLLLPGWWVQFSALLLLLHALLLSLGKFGNGCGLISDNNEVCDSICCCCEDPRFS